MEPGILIALGVALCVVIVAIVATRLLARGRKSADLNASDRDGDATATWLGVGVGRDMQDNDPKD